MMLIIPQALRPQRAQPPEKLSPIIRKRLDSSTLSSPSRRGVCTAASSRWFDNSIVRESACFTSKPPYSLLRRADSWATRPHPPCRFALWATWFPLSSKLVALESAKVTSTIFGKNSDTCSMPMATARQSLDEVVVHVPHPGNEQKEVCMYRIESDRRPDGRPYIRVELPMMCDPLLDILESVASAIVRAVDPQSNWIYYNVACQSSCSPSSGARA